MVNSTDQDIRNRLLLARLPAMPQLLLKLVELCQADEAGMAELAELVRSDAGMTAKVLGIANSAAYQRGDRRADLLQALNTLGLHMLKTLVISESVQQTISGFPHSRSIDLRPFWKHALSTAIMAREIARQMDHPQTEEAYLCGLLHDVGRLALLAAAPNEYSGIFLARDDEALCAVEQRSLEITHAEAGAWLIGRWNLDSFMADSVLYHHEPVARVATAHPLIRIVHLAHRLADHPADEPLPEGMGGLCALPDAVLASVREDVMAQVQREAQLLGIDLADSPAPTPAAVYTAPAAPADPVLQRLEEEVRHTALMGQLEQALARQQDEAQLLDAARQSARILLHLDDSVVLRLDDTGQTLVAAAVGPDRQRLLDFSVSLAGGGALAQSVLQRQPAFLVRGRDLLGVAEEQLLRLFGTDGLLCLPLAVASRCPGLLLSGVPTWRMAEVQAREHQLRVFGAKVAGALEAAAQARHERERTLANLRDDYQTQARKLAHEVRNPLGIIKNYLGVLDDKVGRQEPVTGELSILHEELDRVGHIVHEMADAPLPQQGQADINRVAQDLARLFRESRLLPAGIRIEVQTPDQPAEIAGATNTVKQILLNLVKNAIEALPRGGLIEIVNQGRIYQDSQVYYQLSVRDNGPGLPPEVLNRLFSPVRSSKAGEHRGLGLSIVQDLVQTLGGTVSCASNRAGTAFHLLLPAAVAEPDGSRMATRKDNQHG